MTVQELIEMLEEFPAEMEVRLAEQPNYPFEYNVDGVVEYENNDGKMCAFICEGRQLDYLSREVFDMV